MRRRDHRETNLRSRVHELAVVLAVLVVVLSGGAWLVHVQGPGAGSSSPDATAAALGPLASPDPANTSFAIFQFGLHLTTVTQYLHIAVQGMDLADVNASGNGSAGSFGLRWDPMQIALSRNVSSNQTVQLVARAYIPPSTGSVRLVTQESGWTQFEIYAENVPPAILVESVNFTQKGTISLNSSLLETPGPVTTVHDTLHGHVPLGVYAYYYGWYGALGAWLNGRNGTDSPAVAGEPLSGYYVSTNVSIVDAQIQEAQAAGISAFLESWGQNESTVNQTLQILFGEAERVGFHVGINYETLAALIKPGLTYDQAMARFVGAIDSYLTTYGSSPAMLLLNGTPLIFVWYADAYPAAFWQHAFAEVRQVHPAYFVAETSSNYSAFDTFDGVDEYGVDFARVQNGLATNFTGSNFTQGTSDNYWLMQIEASLHNRFWFAPTEPGFDNANDPSEPLKYVPRQMGAFYAATWDLADWAGADGVTLTSWNEWYEGTNIEPAAWTPHSWSSPYQYLDITTCETHRYLGQNTSGTDTCVSFDSSPPSSPSDLLPMALLVGPLAALVGAVVGVLSATSRRRGGRSGTGARAGASRSRPVRIPRRRIP